MPRDQLRPPAVFRPRADALEVRRCLSAVVDGETFGVRGTDADDLIAITLDGTTATINDNGVQSTIDVPRRKQMRIFLGDGDDRLTVTLVGRSIPATVYGGAGDDTITFRALDERVRIYGEAGGDLIDLSASNPTRPDSLRSAVYGGDGDDFIRGNPGQSLLEGENGNDTVTASPGKSTLSGGNGDDRINGSGGRDLIFGGAGDDRLYGNAGNDTIDGGGNVDRLFGGAGDDSLIGATGNDKLYGEADNDTLIGAAGSDLLDGGGGNDLADDDNADSRTGIETLLT